MPSEPGDANKELLTPDEPDFDSDGDDPAPSAHPTVIPAFDPVQYAEGVHHRERMLTLTDEPALEQARLLSFPTNRPPPRISTSTMPEPRASKQPDSLVEVEVGEDDIDALEPAEQVEILRGRLMPLSRVPMLAELLSEIGHLLEDPQTDYVVKFIDGILPLDTIIEVTGLPELDTLRVLDRLMSLGILTFRARTEPG